MRLSTAFLLTFSLVALPARAEKVDCAFTDEVQQLRIIYYAMIGRSAAPSVREIVPSVRDAVRRLAGRDPALAGSLGDLEALADLLISDGRANPLDQVERARHFAAASGLTTPNVEVCRRMRERPPPGGGATPASDTAVKSEDHPSEEARLWLPVDDAAAKTYGAVVATVSGMGRSAPLYLVAAMAVVAGVGWGTHRGQIAMKTWLALRRDERVPFRRMVAVTCPGEPARRIAALDISRTGMRIALGDNVEPGIQLTIEVAGQTLAGAVRWSNPHFSGVAFVEPLQQSELAEIIAQGGPSLTREQMGGDMPGADPTASPEAANPETASPELPIPETVTP